MRDLKITKRSIAIAKTSATIAGLLLLGACSSIKPWVKPYDRENLADPIMAMEGHGISTRFINHVYESRESARGAEGSTGGGCGCN